MSWFEYVLFEIIQISLFPLFFLRFSFIIRTKGNDNLSGLKIFKQN